MPSAMNLGRLLSDTARRLPDRIGFVKGDRSLTWRELDDRVNAVVEGLRRRGLAKGDRVLVHSRNGLEMFESLWACFKLGAVWVPTNFRLTPPEVAWLARSSGARAMLYDVGFDAHVAAARADGPSLDLVVSIGAPRAGEVAYAQLLEDGAGAPDRPEDVAYDHPLWFFYTSGTTGRPKAGVLTHGQMAFVVTNHLADLMPGITEEDASLVVAPLSHGAGIHALTQVARGARNVLPSGDRLDPGEAWRLVEEHRVTNMFTVPSIVNMLVGDPAVHLHDHGSLRYVIYAGAPMYRADQKRALETLGPILVQYYGLGEVTGNITILPARLHALDDDDPNVGSCGYPRTGMEIAVTDDDGRRLAPRGTGEICVRGPAVFAGYHDNPEADAKAFRDGWFRTGDIGYLDERGFLFITGRASDMYISGGSNVYPREIEEAILTHPAIREVAVVGVPDPKWGESGVAVCVLEPGRDCTDRDVLAWIDGKLARYKWPKTVVFWDELPKSGYGKVPKSLVRERLAESAGTP
ncbi:acyl-CoA synthetase [Arenibaculum sp.]|uniref:acyl-CoA synthetase n=1 Tax=Arenibaculum sp. TaxID=2865862 RepID=UPI002E0DCE16|nr:acyl-CoA synthetase [Arenibaculum sp.]